MIQDISIFY